MAGKMKHIYYGYQTSFKTTTQPLVDFNHFNHKPYLQYLGTKRTIELNIDCCDKEDAKVKVVIEEIQPKPKIPRKRKRKEFNDYGAYI